MSIRKETTYKDINKQPVIGDTCYGDLIGKPNGTNIFVWEACPYCKKERWVRILHNKPTTKRCVGCRQGCGSHITGGGYRAVYIPKQDFFRAMATKSGYVLEHRLVMAKHLKRRLLPWEVVHHRNGVKTDNRLENLELISSSHYHIIDTNLKIYVRKLENKVKELEDMVSELEDILDVYKYEAGE